MERCLREIAAIEAELRAGNPDVAGLLLAYADWHAELWILQNRVAGSNRRSDGDGQPANRATGGGYLATS